MSDGEGAQSACGKGAVPGGADRKAFEETVERLLQAIELGVVAPGERLPAERDLAGRFSVSRVTPRAPTRSMAGGVRGWPTPTAPVRRSR